MAKNKQRKVNDKGKRSSFEQKSVTDARLKLIAKRRTEVSDARLRLKQIQVQKSKAVSNLQETVYAGIESSNGRQGNKKLTLKPIGANIVMKKDGKGKISLQTVKNRQKQEPVKKTAERAKTHNSKSKYRVDNRNQSMQNDNLEVNKQELFRRTIRNDLVTSNDSGFYGVHQASSSRPAPFSRNPFVWVRDEPIARKPIQFSDPMELEDDHIAYYPSPTYRPSTNVRARLDYKSPQLTKTIRNSTDVSGYRIYVTNLQSTVTQEDILELFEDIGELMAAKFVRPGVAEVVYKNYHSAKIAVDVYHNRQLDGQPMKCMLVDSCSRSSPLPTTPLTSSTRILNTSDISSRKSVNNFVTNGDNSHSKFVPSPDIETIHKVLFNKN